MQKQGHRRRDNLEEKTVELPIDGILDLHTFAPGEAKDLVPDYLDACLERGISEVRIIHGKGRGVLRRIVHAALDRHPAVISYRQADLPAAGRCIRRLLGSHPGNARKASLRC